MDTKVDQQITIGVIGPETSSVDANWVQSLEDYCLKISIVGTTPYNLFKTSKITSEIHSSITDILCRHIAESELD
jgi:hypothetical protein